MKVLEAAQRLADHGLRDAHRGVCVVCDQWWTREDPGACPEIIHHLPDCPVPMLPRIVAALATAQAFVGTEYHVTGQPIPRQMRSAGNINRVVRALKG